MTLTERIREKAYELGFDLIGVAPAEQAPHAAAYRRWLAQGYQAEMRWLGRDPERRSDPRQVVPGARSVVVVGLILPFVPMVSFLITRRARRKRNNRSEG